MIKMSFQGSALTFTSLFGDGLKTVEHQNHIFPESGIVTCSIIESSRGSLICVPVTDGFSSDCDSYLTVTELGVQKENSYDPQTGTVSLIRKTSVDCMQEQHEEETHSRLFVHTQHDTVDDGTEVLLRTNADSSNPADCMEETHDEEADSQLFVHMPHDTVEDGSEVLLQSNGDCSNHVDCLEEQHDEEGDSSCRLFVHSEHDIVEERSRVLLRTNGNSCDPAFESQVNQDNSHLQDGTPANSTDPGTKVEKRRGGWPKGKKRRKGPNVTAPKAPTTGYVLFLNKRRKQMQKSNPEMAFSDVTKQIGNEWTNLPMQEKQVYLKKADEEKKRYRKELREYQQSEAYQAYSAKKKKNAEGRKDEGETVTVPIHDIEDEDLHQLYCSVCDQLFTSIHNKREHLYGKQHLSNITGAMHRGTSSNDRNKSKRGSNELEGEKSGVSSDHSRLKESVVSVSDAMDLLVSLSRDQVLEIDFLKQSNINLRQHKSALERDLKLLEELYQKREVELETVRTEGKKLSSQLVDLRMVPKLFGIINF